MKKKYLFEIEVTDEGKVHMSGYNQGFNGFELIGFLDFKKRDIEKQLMGEIKPDTMTRKVFEKEVAAKEAD